MSASILQCTDNLQLMIRQKFKLHARDLAWGIKPMAPHKFLTWLVQKWCLFHVQLNGHCNPCEKGSHARPSSAHQFGAEERYIQISVSHKALLGFESSSFKNKKINTLSVDVFIILFPVKSFRSVCSVPVQSRKKIFYGRGARFLSISRK